MKKTPWFLVVVCSFFMMLASCGFLMGQLVQGPVNPTASAPYIGLVKIQGALMDSEPVLNQFNDHLKDPKCRGILLRVDSPGGAVGAAQEINAKLLQLRQDDFPVITSFGNISASGGVYSTASSLKIFANPGTLTGSIGVITQFPEATELMEKIGVKMNIINSGAHKATGNPFKKLDKASATKMQVVINDTWMQFMEAISVGRGLSIDSIKTFADGSVFTGRRALELGLVDSLGGFDIAKEYIIEQTGLAKSAEFIEITPPAPLIDRLLKEPISSALGGLQVYKSKMPLFIWQ